MREHIPFQPNNLPFEIHTIEWMENNRPEERGPHRHNYYEITWITQGAGTWYIDLEKYDISENDIYCAAPGQVHQWKGRKHARGYVISFNHDFLLMTHDQQTGFINRQIDTPFTKINLVRPDEEAKTEMEHLAQKMEKEFNNFFLLRTEILIGYFRIFLIYLARQTEGEKQETTRTRSADLVKKFFSVIETKFITHKKVTEYAEQLAVTPNYLNEIVKRESGFSASYHIQQRIVLEAKRHATYSSSSMKEIAYHLGFDDIAHFSKFFKNVSGQSFTDFKKQMTYHQYSKPSKQQQCPV